MKLSGLKGLSAWMVYNKVAFSLIFLRQFNTKQVAHEETIARLLGSESLEEIKAGVADLAAPFERSHTPVEICLLEFKESSRNQKKVMLLEALNYSNLDDDDMLKLLAVHEDALGIAYSKENISNLTMGEVVEFSIETMIACSEQSADLSLVSKEQLKELEGKRINISGECVDLLANKPDMTVIELLSLAISKAFKRG